MMWSMLNKNLVRNLKFANLSFIQNPFFSKTLIKHKTCLRYYCPNNIFKFSTTKKYHVGQKYGSLEQMYDAYNVDHNKLKIQQHYNYFLSVFKWKQKIDEKNKTWKIINQYILQHLNRYSYQQISRVLEYLVNVKINNNLKKNAQQLAFKQIHLANLNNLQELLTNLNISLSEGFLQVNAQTQEKYYKIYDRFEQIFKENNQKSIQKISDIQKEQQSEIFDFNKFPILLTQKKTKQYKFQQGYIQMSINVYIKLCTQLEHAKIKSESIFQYLRNNPFMNIYVKENLAKLNIQQLKVLFIRIQKNIYQSQNLKKQNKKYPGLKVILQQIMKRQTNMNQQKSVLPFLNCLLMYAKCNLQASSSDHSQVDQQQQNQFDNSFKSYLAQIMNAIYQNRQNLKMKPNDLVDFVIMGQIIGVHKKSLLKNVVSFAIEYINNLENQNLEINDFESKQMHSQKKKKISSIVWTQIWEKYSTFDTQIQKSIALYIIKCKKIHNIKIEVPNNVKLIEVGYQQNDQQIKNKTKKEKQSNRKIKKNYKDKSQKINSKNPKMDLKANEIDTNQESLR